MRKLRVFTDKEGKPNFLIADGLSLPEILSITKNILDEKMRNDKPKGFAIKEFYDKNTLELQRVVVSIETRGGKSLGIFDEVYASGFMIAYDKINKTVAFPNSIIYETEVSKNGRVYSRKLDRTNNP